MADRTRHDGAGPVNLTAKLLGGHLVDGQLRAGEDIRVAVDQILVEDATGTMAGMQFEQLGVDDVAVPLAVMYVDHNVLQIDDKNMQDHRYLRSFSERYGVRFSPPGHRARGVLDQDLVDRDADVLPGDQITGHQVSAEQLMGEAGRAHVRPPRRPP